MRKNIFLLLLSVFALVSCGGGSGSSGGGSGADYVTIAVDSNAPYTYTETATTSGSDPYIWSSVSGTTSTHLYIHSGSAPRMEIALSGTAAGTYDTDINGSLYYMPADGTIYNGSGYFPGTSGTITITEFGGSGGGKISGSFDVSAAYGYHNSSIAHLVGSFRITRD